MAFLAPILPALSVAGTVVSAVGSLESGLYAGQVSENNKKIALQNEAYTREAGQEEAAIESRKGAARKARVKSSIAAHGVDVNTGSAADVIAGEAETNALDIMTVLHNSDLAAYGYRTQAVGYEAQAKQDVAGGIWGAAGDILSGVSQYKMPSPSETAVE